MGCATPQTAVAPTPLHSHTTSRPCGLSALKSCRPLIWSQGKMPSAPLQSLRLLRPREQCSPRGPKRPTLFALSALWAAGARFPHAAAGGRPRGCRPDKWRRAGKPSGAAAEEEEEAAHQLYCETVRRLLSRVRVVLVEPQGALNVGMVARAMANFGLSDLVIVKPGGKAKDFGGEAARRMACHGAPVLAQACEASSLPEALTGVTRVLATTGRARGPPLPPLDVLGLPGCQLSTLPPQQAVASRLGGGGDERVPSSSTGAAGPGATSGAVPFDPLGASSAMWQGSTETVATKYLSSGHLSAAVGPPAPSCMRWLLIGPQDGDGNPPADVSSPAGTAAPGVEPLAPELTQRPGADSAATMAQEGPSRSRGARDGGRQPLPGPGGGWPPLGGGRAAVVFGREDSGLTNEELSFAQRTVAIPTASECPSLNLSHAVAVICYELSKEVHSMVGTGSNVTCQSLPVNSPFLESAPPSGSGRSLLSSEPTQVTARTVTGTAQLAQARLGEGSTEDAPKEMTGQRPLMDDCGDGDSWQHASHPSHGPLPHVGEPAGGDARDADSGDAWEGQRLGFGAVGNVAAVSASKGERPPELGTAAELEGESSAGEMREGGRRPEAPTAGVAAGEERPRWTQDHEPASAAEIEGLLLRLEALLLGTSFLLPHSAAKRMAKIRRLVLRAAPTNAELGLLYAMVSRSRTYVLRHSQKSSDEGEVLTGIATMPEAGRRPQQ